MGKTFINRVGERYGRLIVVSYQGTDKYHSRVWECLCDCGNTKMISWKYLSNSHARSCGCWRDENINKSLKSKGGWNKKDSGEARFNDLFLAYKRRAKSRNIEFHLTKEQFRKLTKGNCYYCGIEPSQIVKAHDCNGDYIYNGVDRVDSNKSYILENVRSCCKTCNIAKHTMTEYEFINWIKRVASRFEYGETP